MGFSMRKFLATSGTVLASVSDLLFAMSDMKSAAVRPPMTGRAASSPELSLSVRCSDLPASELYKSKFIVSRQIW